MFATTCFRCRRRIDVVAVSATLIVLASLFLPAIAQQSPTSESSTPTTSTTKPLPVPKRSYYDKFLAFPPEYVALLGLGILFIILFIIVVIIICVTARPKYKY